ncbi:MAG: MoxR family ATPase [Actinomycetota bacterium]
MSTDDSITAEALSGAGEASGSTPAAAPAASEARAAEAALVARWGKAILDELEVAVVGKRDVLALLVTGVLADGHILLEDSPGLAKTLVARSIAQVADLEFSRIQFTPDLVPSDITGSSILDLATRQPVFKPGPAFANLVLGDEINRAPPKTQAALLEAMEERQVTIDGVTHELPQPFLVIATQNPIESSGTYPLPEAQLDRFLLKLGLGYPSEADEVEILARRAARRTETIELTKLLDGDVVRALQAAVEKIHVGRPVLGYIAAIVGATRSTPSTQTGASPRGSLALLKAARAWAAMSGRDFVTPDDVLAIAIPALAHRVIVHPDEWLRGITAEAVIARCIESVPAPTALD